MVGIVSCVEILSFIKKEIWDPLSEHKRKILGFALLGLVIFILALYFFATILKEIIPELDIFILVVSLIAGIALSIYWVIILLLEKRVVNAPTNIGSSDEAHTSSDTAQTEEQEP